MPDVYLSGDSKHTDAALSLLRSALTGSDESSQLITLVSIDTEDHVSGQLEAKYLRIDEVLQAADRIVIRPQQGLDIEIRTQPIKHQAEGETVQTIHVAYVEHLGDFVHVVNPYYFYYDRHTVSYRKYCFHVPRRTVE